MYTKHFLKMLAVMIGILIAGVVGLFLINSYHKQASGTGTPPVGTFAK